MDKRSLNELALNSRINPYISGLGSAAQLHYTIMGRDRASIPDNLGLSHLNTEV